MNATSLSKSQQAVFSLDSSFDDIERPSWVSEYNWLKTITWSASALFCVSSWYLLLKFTRGAY